VIALADGARAAAIAAEATARYRDETRLEPTTWICRAVDGARMEES
jgi:hypothetical protein